MSPDDGWMLGMLPASRRAGMSVAECDLAAFEQHEMAQSAVIRELIVIGEAATIDVPALTLELAAVIPSQEDCP